VCFEIGAQTAVTSRTLRTHEIAERETLPHGSSGDIAVIFLLHNCSYFCPLGARDLYWY
jgi:hypothetical protein